MPDHQPGCSCCGVPLTGTDVDIRSTLPDALLGLSDQELATVWGDGTFRRLPGVGAWLRCLMPVRLTGGSKVTYSVWLEVGESQLRRAYEEWDAPGYAELNLTGTVANAIRPWAPILGEGARTEVREAGTLPYLVADEGTLLARVLGEEWDRDDVLSRIGHALPVAVQDRVTPSWSIERTAGLAPHVHDGLVRFVGPGRTVQFQPFDIPAAIPAADAVARITDGAPAIRDGEFTEPDGEVLRHAFWLSCRVDGRVQYEFYGYVAVPGKLAAVTVMYDDAGDLAWAERVWRSIRNVSGADQP